MAALFEKPFFLAATQVANSCFGANGIVYEIGFGVGATSEIAAACTEMLTQVYNHLRHAGVALSVSGIAPPASISVPTIAELTAESDPFGSLAAGEQAALAARFTRVACEPGETLIRQGELPEVVFLIAAGTVEITRDEGMGKRVLLRASPGDSVGMMALISGVESLVTATALTPVVAHSLDKDSIAAVLRDHPALAASLEAQAERGKVWLQCETAAHENEQIERPEMLLARLRQFLQRLNV